MNVLDYRSHTGIVRREKMRAHLIRTAVRLFGQHGFAGVGIDDLIKTAGVARGTFYNYFRTSDELLEAVATTLSNELMCVVDPWLHQHDDPAARVSCGVRFCLQIGRDYPHVAAFISRGGPAALGSSRLLTEYLPRDLTDGIRSGRFAELDPQLAFDLVIGPVLAGFHTLSQGQAGQTYIDDLAMCVLQGLGVPKVTARKISRMSLGDIVVPEGSIIIHQYHPAGNGMS